MSSNNEMRNLMETLDNVSKMKLTEATAKDKKMVQSIQKSLQAAHDKCLDYEEKISDEDLSTWVSDDLAGEIEAALDNVNAVLEDL